MSDLTIFTPISYTHAQASFSQFLLSVADDYFYLGGKRAEVIQGCVEQGSQGVVLIDDSVGYVCTALKVASYLIFIIPFIFGVMKLILRSIYSFHVIPQETLFRMNTPLNPRLHSELPQTPFSQGIRSEERSLSSTPGARSTNSPGSNTTHVEVFVTQTNPSTNPSSNVSIQISSGNSHPSTPISSIEQATSQTHTPKEGPSAHGSNVASKAVSPFASEPPSPFASPARVPPTKISGETLVKRMLDQLTPLIEAAASGKQNLQGTLQTSTEGDDFSEFVRIEKDPPKQSKTTLPLEIMTLNQTTQAFDPKDIPIPSSSIFQPGSCKISKVDAFDTGSEFNQYQQMNQPVVAFQSFDTIATFLAGTKSLVTSQNNYPPSNNK